MPLAVDGVVPMHQSGLCPCTKELNCTVGLRFGSHAYKVIRSMTNARAIKLLHLPGPMDRHQVRYLSGTVLAMSLFVLKCITTFVTLLKIIENLFPVEKIKPLVL